MRIGIAGWNIPKEITPQFPQLGSHLERYSSVFNMVEINSSFYREHMPKTYQRWGVETPEDFRFSVKLSKAFTHDSGLKPPQKLLWQSLENIKELQTKLGVILLQFPGSLDFKAREMDRFYRLIRKKYAGPLVLEPRNLSWISTEAKQLMLDYGVSKVSADPERCEGGGKKILKSGGVTYYRLHGSPVIYRLFSESWTKGPGPVIFLLKNMKKYVIFIVLLIMSFVGSLLLAQPQTHAVLKSQASIEAFAFTSHSPAVDSSVFEDPTEDLQFMTLGLILGLILPGIVRVTTSVLRIWHTKSPLLHLLTDIPPPFSPLS